MGKRTKSVDNAILGENIRKYREQLEISRELLAERIGLSPSYVADVERGTVGISIKTLKSLCNLFGVSADALIFGTSVGIDALLRGAERMEIEQIEELVKMQLKILRR